MNIRNLFWPTPPAEGTAMNRLGFVVYWLGVVICAAMLIAYAQGSGAFPELSSTLVLMAVVLVPCRAVLYVLANR